MANHSTKGENRLSSIPAGLGKLLEQWQSLVAHKDWAKDNDCSWWYGERASVSQLAGAAWMLQGWAMQEYAWRRGDEDAHARIDLAVEIKALKLRFIAEAKQIYPNMRSRAVTLRSAIETEFRKLRSELDVIKPDNWDRVSLVFVSPRIEDAAELEATIPEWISTLCECPDACVWTFPVWSRTTAIQSPVTNMYYPGAALLVRHMSAPVT